MFHNHLLRRIKILIQVSKYFPVSSTNVASYCSHRKHASNILFKHTKIFSSKLYSTQRNGLNLIQVDAKAITASKGENKNNAVDYHFDNNEDLMDDVDEEVELEENVRTTKVWLSKSDYWIKQLEETSSEKKAEKGIELLTNSHLLDRFDLKERLELVQKIWSTLSKSNQLNEKFCEEYLKFMVQNYGEVNPYIFFSDLLENHITITENILLLLLECTANRGKIAEMNFIVETIKEKNLMMTEEVSYFLMLGYAKARDLNEVNKAFQKLKEEGYESRESHVAYLKALACIGEENLLMGHYSYMQENGMVLLDHEIFAVVEALLIGNHLEVIKKVLEWKSGFKVEELKNFIIKLLRLEYDEMAVALLPALPNFKKEDHNFVSYVMRRAVKSNLRFEELVLICKVLISKKASKYSFHAAAECLLRKGLNDESIKMFHVMHDHGFPIRNHYFWPILAALTKAENWEEAFKILEKMKELNVEFHKDVFYYFHRLDPEFAIFKICESSGWNINPVVHSFCMDSIKHGNLKKINSLCSYKKLEHVINKMQTRTLAYFFARLVIRKKDLNLEEFVQPLQQFSPDILGEFLISLAILRSDMITITSFLEVYSQKNLKISEKDARFLKTSLPVSTNEILDLIERITEKQDITKEIKLDTKRVPDIAMLHKKIGPLKTQEYFENLIKTAKREGKDYYFMLCNLLSSYVHCKDYKKASVIRDEMLKLSKPVTPGVKAKLFELSIYEKDLDSSTFYFEDLIKNHPNFGIDKSKILEFASLLIENDFNDEAFKILNYDHQNSLQPPEKLQTHSISLMNNVAKQKDPDLFRKYAKILVEKYYAQLDGRLYAPLIRTLLEDGDYKKAYEEFKYCVERLNVAPFPQQLIVKLIENEDEERLGAVLDLFNRVRHPNKVNVIVCFALADLNRIENLDSYIRKFNLNLFNDNWALRHLDYLAAHGMTDPLECIYFALHPRPESNRLIPYIFQSFDNNKDKSRYSKFINKLNDKNIQFPQEHVKLLASKIYRLPPS